jgi:hypothetical protein
MSIIIIASEILKNMSIGLGLMGGDPIFEYENCADQRLGMPLLECTTLKIHRSLTEVHMRDLFEQGLPKSTNNKFYAIDSKLVPIAIPKENYATTDSWVYENRKYYKISRDSNKTHIKKYPPSVDVILVVDKINEIPGINDIKEFDRFELIKNTAMTFWYSEKNGVTAIGFHLIAQSGEVYTCIKAPCLFAEFQTGN